MHPNNDSRCAKRGDLLLEDIPSGIRLGQRIAGRFNEAPDVAQVVSRVDAPPVILNQPAHEFSVRFKVVVDEDASRGFFHR